MSDNIEDKVRNMPLDWWQRFSTVDELVKDFKTFVVGLLIGGSMKGLFRYSIYTGFLFEHNNKLLWLTAGHVIDDLKAAFDSPDFSLSIIRWLDGYSVSGAESVPVTSTKLRMKSWTSTDLDFGVIVIPFLDKKNLLANNQLRIMKERIWKNLDQASPEGYYVIGYPKIWNEFKETPVAGNKVFRSIKADIACLPLKPVNPPAGAENDPFWNHNNAFYGKIQSFPDMPDFKMQDIVGMSGGPILSIERTLEAKFLYRLAGIQVSWKSESEIVRAEPIDTIASVLADWLKLKS